MLRSLVTAWFYYFELYSLNTVAVTVSFDSIPDNFTRMAQTKTVVAYLEIFSALEKSSDDFDFPLFHILPDCPPNVASMT